MSELWVFHFSGSTAKALKIRAKYMTRWISVDWHGHKGHCGGGTIVPELLFLCGYHQHTVGPGLRLQPQVNFYLSQVWTKAMTTWAMNTHFHTPWPHTTQWCLPRSHRSRKSASITPWLVTSANGYMTQADHCPHGLQLNGQGWPEAVAVTQHWGTATCAACHRQDWQHTATCISWSASTT